MSDQLQLFFNLRMMRNTVTRVSRVSRNNVAKRPVHSAAATCPVTGTSSTVSPTNSGNSRPYKQIPGPKIYPVLGSILDFKENGGSMLMISSLYYKKYGMIVKQNVTGNEVIIYDPIEYLKGKSQLRQYHSFVSCIIMYLLTHCPVFSSNMNI